MWVLTLARASTLPHLAMSSVTAHTVLVSEGLKLPLRCDLEYFLSLLPLTGLPQNSMVGSVILGIQGYHIEDCYPTMFKVKALAHNIRKKDCPEVLNLTQQRLHFSAPRCTGQLGSPQRACVCPE